MEHAVPSENFQQGNGTTFSDVQFCPEVLPEPTKMRTKRILRIHSPDSVNDKYWLKRDRKWTTFGLKTKKYIKLYKTFFPPNSIISSFRRSKNLKEILAPSKCREGSSQSIAVPSAGCFTCDNINFFRKRYKRTNKRNHA